MSRLEAKVLSLPSLSKAVMFFMEIVVESLNFPWRQFLSFSKESIISFNVLMVKETVVGVIFLEVGYLSWNLVSARH